MKLTLTLGAALVLAMSFVGCASSNPKHDTSTQAVPPGSGGRGETPGQNANTSR